MHLDGAASATVSDIEQRGGVRGKLLRHDHAQAVMVWLDQRRATAVGKLVDHAFGIDIGFLAGNNAHGFRGLFNILD
ncbi:hypothetical protein D9M73_218270 [compost metagenome]